MTQYNLRGADGILRAIIPSHVALEIIGESTGEWKKIIGGQLHTLKFVHGCIAGANIGTSDGNLYLVFRSGDTIDIST